MNKKKICFICDSFISDKSATITGPMVQTYLIGKELSQRGWDVHYVAINHEGKELVTETHEGLTVHWIRRRKYVPLMHYRKVKKILETIRADFYYQRGRDVLAGVTAYHALKQGAKFIWASAGDSGIEKGKYSKQIAKKSLPFFLKFLLMCEARINDLVYEYGIRNASRIVVQTEYQRRKVCQIFRLDSIIIKSGHPAPKPVERQWPLKVLWIGTIKPVKRPELFIELASLCKELNCEFWMAGQFVDKKLQSFLLRRMENLCNLKYLGSVPFHESQELISKVHILINTTEEGYEGIPNSFVQAWMTGTVTFSLYTDPDGIIEKYKLGIRTDSLSAMKNEVEKMIENQENWNGMSANTRKFGVENFSLEEVTNQIQDLIN